MITDHSQLLNADPAGRLFNPLLAGGALLDLGVYNVSFALDLLGVPDEIVARGTLTTTGVDAEVSSILTHGVARSEAHTSMISAGPCRGAVIGTEGWLDLAGSFYNWTTVRLHRGRGAEPVEVFEPQRTSRGMHFEALEVERCVADGLTESPRLSLDDSIAVMEVLDELRRQVGCVLPEDA